MKKQRWIRKGMAYILILCQHTGTISRLRLITVYRQGFVNLRAVIMECMLYPV